MNQEYLSRLKEIREENRKDIKFIHDLLVRIRAEVGEEKWSQLDKKYREDFDRLSQDPKPPGEQE